MLLGLLLCTGIALIFYDTLRALILSPVILPAWMCWWDAERRRCRKEEFERQMHAALQSLTAALETGHAVENAMMEVCREQEREGKEQTMVGREFKVMEQELLINVPVETVWDHFAARCGHRDVREIAMVVRAGKRSGGNLIHVMRRCMQQITEKMEVLRQIETILSSRELELKLMLMMPALILIYMRLAFAGMMKLLYHNTAGLIVMTVCLVLYAAAAVLGERIVRACR